MNLLSREQIFGVKDIKSKKVPVPEWGGAVLVRGMTGEEKDAFEAEMFAAGESKADALKNIRGRYAACCIIREDGERLFTDADAAALGKKSVAALDRVFDAVRELSGMTVAEQEEIEKN